MPYMVLAVKLDPSIFLISVMNCVSANNKLDSLRLSMFSKSSSPTLFSSQFHLEDSSHSLCLTDHQSLIHDNVNQKWQFFKHPKQYFLNEQH